MEIYIIGVVGPVRVESQTFIKRFMEHMVLPYMEDLHAEREPSMNFHSSAGKNDYDDRAKLCLRNRRRSFLEMIPCEFVCGLRRIPDSRWRRTYGGENERMVNLLGSI